MRPRIPASEKARKTRVTHTPEEIDQLIAAAVRILESDPTVPPLSLFRSAQAAVLSPSRHRRTETLPREVYAPIHAEALRRLSNLSPGSATLPEGVLDMIGRAMTILIEQSQEQGRAQGEAIAELRRELAGVAREVREVREVLEETVSRLRDEIQALRPLGAEVDQVKRTVDSFRETLERILGDLSGYSPQDPVPPEIPDPGPGRLEDPTPVPDRPVMKIAVLGLRPSQVTRVESSVDRSVRLKVIPLHERFDNQTIRGCDWVVISQMVPHHVSYRVESLIDKDHIRRPPRRGLDAVIQTIQEIPRPDLVVN